MRWGVLSAYSSYRAGTGPTKKQRSEKMYRDYDLGWGRERAMQMRREVEHNRLTTRLARARLAMEVRRAEESLGGGGMVVRSAGAVMALFS
jgi:hypothetical protein